MPDFAAAFARLLDSPVIAADPVARPHLLAFRRRHLLMARCVARHLHGRREVIADIGCHDGFFLRLCEPLGFKRSIGIDFFPHPPERSYLTGLPGSEFLRANFNEDQFLRALPDGVADCVVSTEVFEHLYHHPLGYLQECWRVLRDGGLLLLTTPNPCTLANAWRLFRGRPIGWGAVAFARLPKVTNGEPLAVWDIHFREYAPSELAEVVADLPGVEVVERGFIPSDAAPTDPHTKRVAKAMLRATGLAGWRPFCLSQYMVLRKRRPA
jgi:SAM-dependent methyltransferase